MFIAKYELKVLKNTENICRFIFNHGFINYFGGEQSKMNSAEKQK